MSGHLSSFVLLSSFPRGNNVEPGSLNVRLISAFNATQIIGLVLLTPILLTALLSRKVQRTSTWFIFIISWIISCLSFILLIGQQSGTEPGYSICLFQAALIYAAPPLNAFTALAFLMQFHLEVTHLLTEDRVRPHRRRMLFLVLSPPTLFISICIEVLVLGLQNPTTVKRDLSGLYCHISTGIPNIVSAVLVVFAISVNLIFEVLTAIILSRNWNAFRRLQRDRLSRTAFVSLATMVRITIFNSLLVFAFTLDLIDILNVKTPLARLDIVTGTLPTATALLFGTQRDIVRVWMFWRKASTSDLEFIPTKDPKTGDVNV